MKERMKSKMLVLLYTALFVLFFFYALAGTPGNRLPLVVFAALAFSIPLVFTGFHPSLLAALAQFLNFFWFRLVFADVGAPLAFVAVLCVIPLSSLAFNDRIRKKRLRILHVCLVTATVFFGAELMIRLSPLDTFLDMKQRMASLSARIEAQSNCLVDHRRDTVFTDAVGRKFPVKKAKGVYRIVCLGSSSTEGHGAGMESYPVLLEGFFRGKAQNVEVINAGAPGIRFYNLSVYFREVLSNLEPDLLVVYFGYNSDSFTVYRYFQSAREIKRKHPYINNAEDLEYALNFRFCSPRLLTVYRWLFSSRLFAAAKLGFNNVMARLGAKSPDERQEFRFRENNVRALADFCAGRHIPLILVPEMIVYDDGEYAGYFSSVRDEGRGVYYYRPRRPGLAEYLTDSVHFNKEGNAALAGQLGSFILDKNLIRGTRGSDGG